MKANMNLVWIFLVVIIRITQVHSGVVTCERKMLQIKCPQKQVIRIRSANYGRTKNNLCGTGRTNCRSAKTTEQMKNKCEGKHACNIKAENQQFGDTCPNVEKYLEVDYTCENMNPVQTNPCKDYTLDTDTASWQRSTGYIIPANSKTQKCDRPLATAWYRFDSGAGNEMPTSCPPVRACGTKNPIWLQGDHPKTVGEEKSMKACVQISKDACCANSWNIDVKKCSTDGKEFFVYKLIETPGCPMSYCVGEGTKCPQGESSATGFTPCSSKFPKLNGDPQISVDVANKRMRFKCKFDPEETGADVRHEVVWYGGPPEAELDRKVLARDDFKGDTTEAYLQNTNKYGEKPTFCLNQNIYCEVRSYYVGKEQFGFKRKSNEYYAGLVIDPKEVILGENSKPINVNIKSTVPIVCQDGTENCHVQLEVGQAGTKDSFVDYCTLKFKPGPKGRSLDLQVVAKRDFVDDGDQQMKIKLFVPDHVDPVDWNCYKNISDINVKTRDVTTARCKSTGDPHLTTFDGRYYNHFHVGDYVFVKSEARLFEVHVRTFRCHTVSCNCGVAAREGDDVLVVDMCRDNVPRARYASTVQPQKETTIERSENGKVFVLNFPSGAYVRFEAKKWFGRWHYANIVIQVPSDDFDKTKGLCGTWDRNKNNDLTAKDGTVYGTKSRRIGDPNFTESWKLTRDESLFYYKGGEKKCLAERFKSYCTCSENCCGEKRRVNCDFEGYSQRPKYVKGFRGYKKLDFPGAEHCGKRRKRRDAERSIMLPEDGLNALYEYNPEQRQATVPNFPTPSGISEAKARSECDKALRNSETGLVCLKTVTGFSIADIVEQCMMDVQVLDSIPVATESAINTMTDQCEEITLREVNTYWKKDTTGNLQPPQDIENSVCPNECSGHGKCMNATCACDQGYISTDCSIKEGEPPVMYGVAYNGLCDIRNQDCARTRVVGYNFIDSPNLKCRTTQVKISDKPHQDSGRTDSDEADLLSFAELSCPLPRLPVEINYGKTPGTPAGGFLIQLSNDGVNYSKNSSFFLVYDSKCMDCTKTGDRTCKWKANSCKINNYCFAQNDSHPDDWCQVCDVARSNTTFVKRLVNLAPEFRLPRAPLMIFKGQKWRYEVPVQDPEKRPMKYEFVGDSHGMEISSAGVITWTPKKVNETYKFTVKATDPCGKSSEGGFTVKTRVCYCEGNNGGYCEWKMNIPKCVCPDDGCLAPTCMMAKEARVCAIRVEKDKDEDDSSSAAVIAIVVVLVILILVAVCGALYYLHKQGKITLPIVGGESNGKKTEADQSMRYSNGKLVPQAVNDYENKLDERRNKAFVED